MPPAPCRLYLITPPAFAPSAFLPALAAALAAGDVACVQLRLKRADGRPAAAHRWLAASRCIRPLLRRHRIRFLLNDRVELVRACGADGVHLGPSDMPCAAARAQLGARALIGISCQASRRAALNASAAGADYVAFGAFYPSATKASPHRPQPELLRWWRARQRTPCAAIGGIVPANAPPLIAAGANFLAVCQGVWAHEAGPAAAVAAFARCLQRAHASCLTRRTHAIHARKQTPSEPKWNENSRQ